MKQNHTHQKPEHTPDASVSNHVADNSDGAKEAMSNLDAKIENYNWIGLSHAQMLSDKKLSSSAKVVYAAISSFTANGKKMGFPSHAAIAARAGLNVRSIPRLVLELRTTGYITVHPRGHGWNNLYEISTLKSDESGKSHRIPASYLDAGMRTRSIKRIEKRNSIPNRDNAETLYAFYAEHVRPGAKADTVRSITKLLSEHSFEELMEATKAYAHTPQARGDVQYRYKPNNFFGKKEYFKDFLHSEPHLQPSVLPQKALTPEEQMIRQRLIDAGQA